MVFKRNFFPYFAGNLLSNCGTWFQNLAQTLLIYRLTGSTLLVGVVNFSLFVGTFVLAPWSGSAADRFERRRLLVTTQAAAVAITAVLALLAANRLATTPVVIGMALLLGCTTAFSVPALQALVPLLVEPEELAGAVTLNSITFNLARAIGPLLGALVVARLGIAAAFGINSLSYITLIIGLAVIRPRPQSPRPTVRPRLSESIRLVRNNHRLFYFLLAVVSLSLTADPVNTLTPAFATRLFHRPDTLVGLLVGAFGTGSVVAALTIASRRNDPTRRVPRMLGLLGVAMVCFAISPGVGFAVVTLFVGGFGFLAANTTATTSLQLEVDDSQRGRIMALWSVAFLGIRPIGSLLDGLVATAVGPRGAALVMAVPALLAAVFITLGFRTRSVT